MGLEEIFRIAIESLRANKVRSLLTMLGIIIGVASVILLISIGSGLKDYITGQLEDLGANALFIMPGEIGLNTTSGERGGIPGAGVANSKFTLKHLQELKKEGKNIKLAMAYIENNGTMKYKGKTHTTQVVGVGPEYPEIRNQKVKIGSFFTPSQYNSAKRVAVLGKTVAEELFDEENPVGKKITISDQRYTVLGVLEEKGAFGSIDMDNQVFIPATTAMRHFDLENVQSFWIQAKDSQSVEAAKKEAEKILLKSLKDEEFSVLDTKSLLGVISDVLNVLTLALAGIAAISLLVGGIGIMNIMLVSVTERTREIGLRKALGATSKMILIQFLIEATILSLLGGMIGVFIGVVFSLFLKKLFTTVIALWSIFLAFGVSALVGIIFGVAPAAKAAKLDPIEALRYE